MAEVLFHHAPGQKTGCLAFGDVIERGSSWPAYVPVQVHAVEADPYFVDGGDLAAARALGTR
jgi:hypothetical protein